MRSAICIPLKVSKRKATGGSGSSLHMRDACFPGGFAVSEEQLSSYSHGKNTMIFNIFLPIVSRSLLYRVRFLSISFFFSFSLSLFFSLSSFISSFFFISSFLFLLFRPDARTTINMYRMGSLARLYKGPCKEWIWGKEGGDG